MSNDRKNDLLSDCIKMVRNIAPDIDVNDYEILRNSHSNLVALINKKYVFKFPKDLENSYRLEKEIKLLKMLNDSPIRIPHYIYEGQKGAIRFGGYRFIAGKPLNSRRTLTSKMLYQLIDFLNFLQEKKYDELESSGIDYFTPTKWIKQFVKLEKVVRSKALDRFDSKLWKSVEREFRTFTVTKFYFEPTLIHGDLYRDNVLIRGNTLSSIIDWGYSSFGDPAMDIAAIAVDFPKEAQHIAGSIYEKKDEKAERRIEFYIRTEPLFEILDGVLMKNNDQVLLGMDRLEHSIERNFDIFP